MDNEQEGLLTGLHSDPRVLVATTIATLVVATGSAFIWRSNQTPSIPARNSGAGTLERARSDPDPGYLAKAPPGENRDLGVHSSVKRTSSEGRVKIVLDDRLTQDPDSKDSKNSRSKERRRRGKDPLKEILKGGKKVKGLVKSGRPASDTDGGGSTTTTLPQILEPELSEHSRDTSVATSSRSVSSSASSIHGTTVLNPTDPTPGPGEDSKSSHDTDDDDYFSSTQGRPSYTPVGKEFTLETHDPLQAQTQTQFEAPSLDHSSYSQPHPHNESTSNDSEVPKPLKISLSSSSSSTSTSHSNSTSTFASTSASSESVITTNTTTHTSPASHLPSTSIPFSNATRIHPSQSMPSYIYPNPNTSTRQKFPSPWDWDGHATPTNTSTNDTILSYRKPPRFRPKSRASNSGVPPTLPVSSPMPTSISMSYASPFTSASTSTYTTSPVGSPSLQSALLSPTSTRAEVVEDASSPFTFPTLNTPPSSGPSPGPSISPGPNRHLHANGNVNSDGTNPSTPRRIGTPRHTPTPSPSQSSTGTTTPPQSLSMQTQIASLRGALEAARMREEKARAEIERYAKESEMMRWEGAAWRRTEAELQTQIHHLMHQVQGYAAVFASMSPTSSLSHSLSTSHLQGGNSNSNGITISNQHYQNPNSPLSLPQSPQSHLQMFSTNGMLPQTSPPHANSHFPFFAYSSQPNSHTHMHSQAQTQPPHQSNLLSMLFPLTSAVNDSGRSSVSGSSSVGSLSPDLGSSPTPAPMMFDRGRRRTRTRTQTANARIGGMGEYLQGDGDGGNGWIEVGDGVDGEEDGDRENVNGDEHVNELLADAILKRPGSIRVGSNRESERRGEQEAERQPEFTFASISDFGNVDRSTYEGKEQAGGRGDASRREIVLDENGDGGGRGERGNTWYNERNSVEHRNGSEPVLLHVDAGISRTTAKQETHPAG